MVIPRRYVLLIASWLATSATGPQLRAEQEQPPIKITLHPAAESQPALKYRLLPEVKDRIPGNAAVYYGKVKAEQNALFGNRELWENVYRWIETPLDELRREDAQLAVNTPIYFLEQAALCDDCDWQLPIRDEPFYGILLPEAQESRQFARLLVVKARIAMAHGDFDAAMKHLQTSYALARNVAKGQTLVNGLIGVAVCGMNAAQIRDLIQQPAAPNLYWAIADLPVPMIDFRLGIEAELGAAEMAIPELSELKENGRAADQWRGTLLELWNQLHVFSDEPPWKKSPEYLLAMSLRNYPQAKRALVERGMSARAVDAMPVAQVILMDAMYFHKMVGDEISKWFHLPYPVARKGMAAAYGRADKLWSTHRETVPLSQTFIPALQTCRAVAVRAEREIALLRVLEALRVYGAGHEGRLPERLSDVTEVPVPNDPVTEQPFVYRLQDGVALLESMGLSAYPVKYQIDMVRP